MRARCSNDEYVESVTNWTQLLVDSTSLGFDMDTLLPQLLELYPPPDSDAEADAGFQQFLRLDGDSTLICPMLQVAGWAHNTGIETYHSVFAFGPAGRMVTLKMDDDTGSLVVSSESQKYGSGSTRRGVLLPMDNPEGESRHLATHGDVNTFLWLGHVLWAYPSLRLLAERLQVYYSSLSAHQGLRSVTMSDGTVAHWDPLYEHCTYNDTRLSNDKAVSVQTGCQPLNETNTLVFDMPGIQHRTSGYKKDICAFWNNLLAEPPYVVNLRSSDSI